MSAAYKSIRNLTIVLAALVAVLLCLFCFQLLKDRCGLSKNPAVVNFVGHTLYLPSPYVRYCAPSDYSTSYDYDPAGITFAALLPNWDPILDRTETSQFIQEHELRINLEGVRPDISQIDPNIRTGQITLDFSPYADRQGSHILIYNQSEKEEDGLIHYLRKTSAAGAAQASDVYVHKGNDDKVDFVLRCGLKHSKCGCISESETMFDNVTFNYCLNVWDLPRAIEIHEQVKNFLAKLQKNPNDK